MVRKKLTREKLSAVLISAPANLAYLTGLINLSKDERDMWLLITANKQIVITDPRFSGLVKGRLPKFELLEISSGKTFKEILTVVAKEYRLERIGLEENDLRVSEYKFFRKVFLKTVNFSLDDLRQIKDKEELDKIKTACRITDEAFDYVAAKIKPGITEQELANELEIFIKKQGGELAFDSIVAFSKNSAVPHHQTSDKKLSLSDKIVLLDFGAKWQGYCSDITRTILIGSLDKKINKVYEVVLRAQQKAVDYIQDNLGKNIKVSAIDKIVRQYLIRAGYPDIPHSLGHGVGLVIHERPHLSIKSKEVLKEGMVFSIEPGIYLPNLGGIRIEDLFVVQKGTLWQLTHAKKN